MHISESRESSNTILTKCAKMNEDSHKRLVINGNSDGNVVKVKEESSKNLYAPHAPGGRLKFFKDGKFILELERAKEGERVSWVSVPRKTFWPPQGVATSVTCKQESSTSLSISDDNSSIQSSPWQRDHFWKQTTPRKNLSKPMSFYLWRPKNARSSLRSSKLRRPFSTVPESESPKSACTSVVKTEMNVCNKFQRRTRRTLLVAIQNLIDHVSRAPSRVETLVSPRKRFLRDMEKDKAILEDNGQKRIRNKVTGIQASTSGGTMGGASPLRINGHSEEKPAVSSVASSRTAKNCSYSITSLLAEDRAPAKSLPSNSPSHLVPVTTQNFNSSSVKPEELWYSESVERFRSIELSHADKNSFHSYPPHSYLPPFVYPYSFPPCYAYNRGFPPIPPPMYHHLPAHHLPVPMVKQEAPSCSWKTERLEEVDLHKEESSASDMPLNLSKHA